MKKKKPAMTGDEFKAIREKINMTQEQAALFHGVEVTTISRWERGVAPIRKSPAVRWRSAPSEGWMGKGPRQRGGPKKSVAQKLKEKREWDKDAITIKNEKE